MPNFKEGQKIRMEDDCISGFAKKGDICTISINRGNRSWAKTQYGKFCGCSHLWELVEEPEKTWDNLEVGNSVWDEKGSERKILGICGKIIFYSFVSDMDMCQGFGTKEDLMNFEFTLTPPQETITKEEAEKMLNKKIK